MLDHKTSLSKFKEIEIISGIFSDHSGMELEINYKKKMRRDIKIWRNQHATEQPMGHQRNQEK